MDKYVRVAFVSDEHLDCLNTFELPEEQVQYTRLPRDVSDLQEWQYPIVILAGEEPVGFFLLHRTERVKEFTGNPDAILLTAFSIDFRQQGKGYAKQGLQALPGFVAAHFTGCDEVVLAVNHKNIPAQNVYRKTGFSDTGIRRMGPRGEQFIMRLIIPGTGGKSEGENETVWRRDS